jgi:hypothetical protein
MRASEHGLRALAENRNLACSITADTRDYGHLGPDYQDGTAQLFDIAQRDDGVWIYSVAAVLLEALSHALAGECTSRAAGWAHAHARPLAGLFAQGQ